MPTFESRPATLIKPETELPEIKIVPSDGLDTSERTSVSNVTPDSTIDVNPTQLGKEFLDAWMSNDAIRLKNLLAAGYRHEENKHPDGDVAIAFLKSFPNTKYTDVDLFFTGTVQQYTEFHSTNESDTNGHETDYTKLWGIEYSDVVSEFVGPEGQTDLNFRIFWRKSDGDHWRVIRSTH